MNFKVGNTSGVNKSEKKSKTKATSAEGSAFASALQDASSVNEAAPAAQAFAVDTVTPVFVDAESSRGEVPEKAKDRSYYVLDLLEELEKDILTGNDTKVAKKLEKALENKAIDLDNLPKVVRELMEEIDLRASIELEKLKQLD